MGTSTGNGPHRIAVIGGDGIGPEVIAEALSDYAPFIGALGTTPYAEKSPEA